MTEDEFRGMFVQCASDVADLFYPKFSQAPASCLRRVLVAMTDRPSRRGEFLRDQAVLCAALMERLKDEGVIRG